MFFVRYKDSTNGSYIVASLTPGPTEVEYPDARLYKLQSTPDGATVIQRPLRDDRVRKWVWKNYRPSIAPYEHQWKDLLVKLDYRYRLEHALPPLIEIWEDVVEEGGFSRVDGGGNKLWTKVKVIMVNRVTRKGGGLLVYDTSEVQFVIADDTYTGF